MDMHVGLNLRLEQKLKLAPQIIQSIEILQLPIMELQERIAQELQENPVLEVQGAGLGIGQVESDAAPEGGPAETGPDDELERLAKLDEEWREYFSRPASRDSDGEDRKLEAIQNTASPDMSLQDYLFQQFGFLDAKPSVRKAAESIIYNINDGGWLQYPLEETAQSLPPGVTLKDAEEALRLVQGLDPPGVGARDLKECLLLQIRGDLGNHPLARKLIEDHLDDILKNRIPKIAKATGESIEDVQRAIEFIATLNPRPGILFGGSAAPHVVPDVAVDLVDGRYQVRVEDDRLPRVRISSFYRRMLLQGKGDAEARKYIQKKIESAKWLVDAIEQRKHTLQKISTNIVDFQRLFLEKGISSLRPLKMQSVADAVGVHVSTVSRAIAGKYMQTPQGLFPIRFFFTGGTTRSDGRVSSWKSVKEKIRGLIDKEDKCNPLSDEEVAARLSEEGLQVARRTVTKYRKAMKIRSSRERKQYS